MAVLPTPASPISTGLFLVRRLSTWMTRRISPSRPMTGSSLPSCAIRVRSRLYFLECPIAALGLRVCDALPAAYVLNGVGHAVACDAVLRQRLGHGRIVLVEQGQKDMLGADVFIAQAVGFFVGAVNHALEARGDEDLVGALAVDGGRARAAPQQVIHTRAQGADVDGQALKNLRHDAVGLLQQRHEDVLSIDLGVAVPVENLVSAGGGVLRAFGESVETDHGLSLVATFADSAMGVSVFNSIAPRDLRTAQS